MPYVYILLKLDKMSIGSIANSLLFNLDNLTNFRFCMAAFFASFAFLSRWRIRANDYLMGSDFRENPSEINSFRSWPKKIPEAFASGIFHNF